jgi:hypothetical protein
MLLRDGYAHGEMTQQDRDEIRDLLVAANDTVDAFGVFWRKFRSFRRIPVSVQVNFLGLKGTPMSFQMPDDQTTTATLTFRDEQGGVTSAPANEQATWSVSDATLAQVTPSSDTLSAEVKTLAGVTSGSFDVAASIGTLSGTSEPIQITPGAPVAAGITLTLQQNASAEEAKAIHEGRQIAGQ